MKVVTVREEINNHTVEDFESFPINFEEFLMDASNVLESCVLLSAFVFR